MTKPKRKTRVTLKDELNLGNPLVFEAYVLTQLVMGVSPDLDERAVFATVVDDLEETYPYTPEDAYKLGTNITKICGGLPNKWTIQ